MATGSGNAPARGAPLVQFDRSHIADDMFVRCPKSGPRFDHVQVREACPGCPHHLGFVEDPTGPGLYGSACAFPVARWWRRIVIHKPATTKTEA